MTTTRSPLHRRIAAAGTALTLALGAAFAGAAATSATAAAAPAGPLGSLAPIGDCEGPAPRVTPFGDAAPPVLGWRENLVFDGRGRLWVSSVAANRVDAYDPQGRRVASVDVGSPGGLAVGPTGEVFVVTDAFPLSPTSTIWGFDPTAAQPVPRHVATLPGGRNGLAADAEGNLYTTAEAADRVLRVRPDGTVDHDWSARAAVHGTNGIAIRGGEAVVSVTFATDTVLHTVPLDRPEASRATVLTRLPELARGLDDLAITDTAVYVVGMTAGEILRVDRASGAACVLLSGLPGPTSVRVAEGFGPFGERDLFVTAVDGQIRHVALP